MESYNVVREIVAKIIDADPESIGEDDNLIDHHQMDSLMLFDVAVELEESFNVKIPDTSVNRFVSLRAIKEVLRELVAIGSRTSTTQ